MTADEELSPEELDVEITLYSNRLARVVDGLAEIHLKFMEAPVGSVRERKYEILLGVSYATIGSHPDKACEALTAAMNVLAAVKAGMRYDDAIRCVGDPDGLQDSDIDRELRELFKDRGGRGR